MTKKVFTFPKGLLGCIILLAYPMLMNAQTGCATARLDYLLQIGEYRDSLDLAFATDSTSILMPEDTAGFSGLEYFAVNEKFRVYARFERIENARAEKLKTSGTRTPLYKAYATLIFELDSSEHRLTLYQFADPSRPELASHLMLAFTDLTSGNESYGGGRYLDFTTDELGPEKAGAIWVDFNYAYNPYCAYNHSYSCVLPPPGNHVPVKIEAGVRKFHD